FFFADYEGTRITRGATRLTNVPTADQRNGIFTSTIIDPTTGQPFPNNTIPANRIDPYAAGILGLVPMPNQAGANNFFRTADLIDNSDRLLTRIDWRPSSADSVFGRYIYSTRTRDIPGAFGGVLDGTGTSAFGNQAIKTNAFVAGWTRVLSNRMVNEARFSWSQAKSDAVQQSFGLTPPAAAQIPGMITDPIVAGGLPGISISGYFGGSGLGRLGSPDFLPKFQHTNQFEYIDTLSWLRGNHAFKFGADIIAPMNNAFFDVPATRGAMSFNGGFTGNSLADFLLGYVSGFQLSNVYVVHQQHSAQMFFAQDDWKASDRLTLNLGLRYDFMTPATEAGNNQTNFDPATGTLIFASSGSLENRALVKPDRNNFGPRVGFVYKLDDKTNIRGGWGVFYNLFDRVGSEDQLALNLPGLVNTSLSRTSGTPLFLLQQGIPAGFLAEPSLNPADGQLKSIRIRAVDQNDPATTVNEASLGLQRELPGAIVASADFVYTRGRNLATLVNLNQPLASAPGANDAKGALPYPNFGFIEWRADNGKSQYAGVDVGVEKRFGQGYAFGLAYT
ncbi:MAG TPA: TonB-dependent receptor, partial [Vicinamibacterales bacterium]|nr:TonB-dependent receptor [Vicinamibacterales bacterium]